jgi:hypothetical protein
MGNDANLKYLGGQGDSNTGTTRAEGADCEREAKIAVMRRTQDMSSGSSSK